MKIATFNINNVNKRLAKAEQARHRLPSGIEM